MKAKIVVWFFVLFVLYCGNEPIGLVDNVRLLCIADTTIKVGDSLLLSAIPSINILQGSKRSIFWQCSVAKCLVGKIDSTEIVFSSEKTGRHTVVLTVKENGVPVILGKAFIMVKDSMTDSIGNLNPVAKAGNDSTISMVKTRRLRLDGRASYHPENKQLSYRWESVATNPEVFPVFAVDTPVIIFNTPGRYTFILTVSDGRNHSLPDQITISYLAPDIVISKHMLPGEFRLFRTIRDGLAEATSGDTIFVDTGTFIENDTIATSNLYLFSSDSNTVINGDYKKPGISILNANGVSVKNIKIVNSGTTDVLGIHVGGILIYRSNNISIDGMVLSENNGDGIRIINSNDVMIQRSKFIKNDWNGIRATSSSMVIRDSNQFLFNGIKDDSARVSAISLEMLAGDITSYYVTVENSIFIANRGGHHLGIYGPFRVLIQRNRFLNEQNQPGKMIGEAIRVTAGAKPAVTISNCFFSNKTPITSIFIDDATSITLENDTLQSYSKKENKSAIDIVNCFSGRIKNTQFNLNDSASDYGHYVGIKTRSSPIEITDNVIFNCTYGILLLGDSLKVPILSNNQVDTTCTYKVVDSTRIK